MYSRAINGLILGYAFGLAVYAVTSFLSLIFAEYTRQIMFFSPAILGDVFVAYNAYLLQKQSLYFRLAFWIGSLGVIIALFLRVLIFILQGDDSSALLTLTWNWFHLAYAFSECLKGWFLCTGIYVLATNVNATNLLINVRVCRTLYVFICILYCAMSSFIHFTQFINSSSDSYRLFHYLGYVLVNPTIAVEIVGVLILMFMFRLAAKKL